MVFQPVPSWRIDPAHFWNERKPVQPIPRNIPVDATSFRLIMMNAFYPATAQYPVRIVTRALNAGAVSMAEKPQLALLAAR